MNAHSIDKILHKKRAAKKEMYMTLYKKIYRRIEDRASMGGKQIEISVPVYTTGFPPYNVEETTKYLVRQLNIAKFKASYVPPNIISVSWGHTKLPAPQAPSGGGGPSAPETSFASLANLKKLAKNLV